MAVAITSATTANLITLGFAYDVLAHSVDVGTQYLVAVVTARSQLNGPTTHSATWNGVALAQAFDSWTAVTEEIGVWCGYLLNPASGTQTFHFAGDVVTQMRGVRVDLYNITGAQLSGSPIGTPDTQNHGSSGTTQTVTLSIVAAGGGTGLAICSMALVDAASGVASFASTPTGFTVQGTDIAYGRDARVNITSRYHALISGTVQVSATFLTGDTSIGGALFEVLPGPVVTHPLALAMTASTQLQAGRTGPNQLLLAVTASMTLDRGGDPQNPAQVWVGAGQVWDQRLGKEIKTGRALTVNGLTAALIGKRPASLFQVTSNSYARDIASTTLGVQDFSHEVFLEPSALPSVADNEGRIFRAGSTSVITSTAYEMRIIRVSVAAANLPAYGLSRRDSAGRDGGTSAAQFTTTPGDTPKLNVPVHFVSVFPAGQQDQIWIDGTEVAEIPGGVAPVTGVLPIRTGDEAALGTSSPVGRPTFIGKMGRQVNWPFLLTQTHINATLRHQAFPLLWIGQGGEDALADTNHAPVAVPLRASANSGVSVTIDPVAVAFDEDGNALSITGTPTVDVGTVSVTAGKLRYTAPSSFTGTATISFTLADPGGKTSSSVAIVTVTVAAGEYPATTFTVTIPAGGDLGQKLLNAYTDPNLKASTTIRLPDGTYNKPAGGRWAFNGGVIAGLSATAPILIRAINVGQAIFNESIDITANDHMLIGVKMAAGQQVALGTSQRARVSRCYFAKSAAGGHTMRLRKTTFNAKIDYCDFDGSNATAFTNGMGIYHNEGNAPDVSTGQNTHIYSCNFHDHVDSDKSVNGATALAIGNDVTDTTIAVGCLVEFNLFDAWLGDPELTSIKSSGNTLRGNASVNNSHQFNNRHGSNNRWIANWSNATGFRHNGRGTLYLGNFCAAGGTADININSGELTQTEWDAGGFPGSGRVHPASEGVVVSRNTGDINVGKNDPTNARFAAPAGAPARDTRIEAQVSGALNLGPAPSRQTNTNTFTATAYAAPNPAARRILTTEVGPLALYVPLPPPP